MCVYSQHPRLRLFYRVSAMQTKISTPSEILPRSLYSSCPPFTWHRYLSPYILLTPLPFPDMQESTEVDHPKLRHECRCLIPLYPSSCTWHLLLLAQWLCASSLPNFNNARLSLCDVCMLQGSPVMTASSVCAVCLN